MDRCKRRNWHMFGLRFPRNTPEHTASWYAASIIDDSNHPALDTSIDTDVAVVGGGFTGVNTALELCERGREVADFVANALGPEGMARTVVVTATADEANAIIDAYRDPFLSIAVMPVRDRRLVAMGA